MSDEKKERTADEQRIIDEMLKVLTSKKETVVSVYFQTCKEASEEEARRKVANAFGVSEEAVRVYFNREKRERHLRRVKKLIEFLEE